MSTAKQVLDFALKFKGTTETPPGSNIAKPFCNTYGVCGVPWCAEFTWYVLSEQGVPIIKSAYTPTIAQWFTDQKRGFADDSKIQPGDLLFFDFPDSLDRIQHIGFALEVPKNGRVKTIEGNTSSGSSGSQDNGGGVFVRDRGFAELVYIGRPDYDEHEKLPRFDLPKTRTWLRVGDKGADVLTLQRDLNKWMRDLREDRGDKIEFDFGKIEASGEFTKDTRKALVTFQMQHPRLEPDGMFGRETERVLENVRKRQAA